MKQFKELLQKTLSEGNEHEDRTGVGRISLFGPQAEFSLQESFPAITLRKLFFKTMVKETLWFLKGTDSCDYLDEQGVGIWKQWTHPTLNSVGPLYGVQLRKWRTSTNQCIDQLARAIDMLKMRPFASDNVITLWNPETRPDYDQTPEWNVEHGKQALAACHGTTIQFFARRLTTKERSLALTTHPHLKAPLFGLYTKCYQRSQDSLAFGFNVGQYSLLNCMIANLLSMVPIKHIHTWGDFHIYSNHVAGVKEMLTREPLLAPTLKINPDVKHIDDYKPDDFELVNYQHHEHIQFSVAR